MNDQVPKYGTHTARSTLSSVSASTAEFGDEAPVLAALAFGSPQGMTDFKGSINGGDVIVVTFDTYLRGFQHDRPSSAGRGPTLAGVRGASRLRGGVVIPELTIAVQRAVRGRYPGLRIPPLF